MQAIHVVAGIIWREGRYLAAQRPLHKRHGGYWEFPGGKVEEGESLEQALARELSEELTISVEFCTFWQKVEHVYPESQGFPPRLVCVHFFHVTQFSGEPCGAEGQKVQWIWPDLGPQMSFLEADIGLVRDLCAFT